MKNGYILFLFSLLFFFNIPVSAMFIDNHESSDDESSASSGSDSSDDTYLIRCRKENAQKKKQVLLRIETALGAHDLTLLKKLSQEEPQIMCSYFNVALLQRKKSVLDQLYHAKINLSTRDEEGYSALSMAVRAKLITEIPRLLQMHASINQYDAGGQTPLLIAVDNNDNATVRLLLDNQANPDLPDKDGRTPLMHAAQRLKDELVALLLDYKADATLKDCHGWTAIEYITNWAGMNKENQALVDLIKQHQSKR